MADNIYWAKRKEWTRVPAAYAMLAPPLHPSAHLHGPFWRLSYDWRQDSLVEAEDSADREDTFTCFWIVRPPGATNWDLW